MGKRTPEQKAERKAKRRAWIERAIEQHGAPALAAAVQAGLPTEEAVQRAATVTIEQMDRVMAFEEPAETISDVVLRLFVRPVIVSILRDGVEWAEDHAG